MKYKNVANANLVIDSYIILTSLNKKTWYLKMKITSKTIRELLKVNNELLIINSSIDEAISLITLLNYSTISNKFYKIPDRILTEYLQISRKKIKDILQVISNTELIDTMWIDGELQYKLNLTLIKNDKFILFKRKKMYNRYDDIKRALYIKYGTYYFNPYHNSTVHRAQRQNIIGLTLAANDYDNKSHNKLSLYNDRNDIFYVEIPYKQICKTLNITEADLSKKLQMLCKQTSYIKKHNLVYIDGTEKHFYNKNYKNCPLIEFTKDTNINKPKVTEWSYIIFKDELEHSNIFKFINKKINYFKAIMNNLITPLAITNNKFMQQDFNKTCDRIKDEDLYQKGFSVIDMYKMHQRTSDKFKYNRRIKIPNIVDLTIAQINKYMKLILELFNKDKVSDDDMKYYVTRYQQLEKQKLYLCNS